jgi:hypothetical protein
LVLQPEGEHADGVYKLARCTRGQGIAAAKASRNGGRALRLTCAACGGRRHRMGAFAEVQSCPDPCSLLEAGG